MKTFTDSFDHVRDAVTRQHAIAEWPQNKKNNNMTITVNDQLEQALKAFEDAIKRWQEQSSAARREHEDIKHH
jgi:hypothetical protein